MEKMLTNDLLWISNVLDTQLWVDILITEMWLCFGHSDWWIFRNLWVIRKAMGPAWEVIHDQGKNYSKRGFERTLGKKVVLCLQHMDSVSSLFFAKHTGGKLPSRDHTGPLHWTETRWEEQKMSENTKCRHYTPCKAVPEHSQSCWDTQRVSPETWSLPMGHKWPFYLSSQVKTFNKLLGEECIEIGHRIHLYMLYI